jgi:hypothetical protein
MIKIYKSFRILVKYLRKFLASIVSIIPLVKINMINYPFSKEYKALNQDFISIGDDLKLVISKQKHNAQLKK